MDTNHNSATYCEPEQRLKPSLVPIPYLCHGEYTTYLSELLGELFIHVSN